MSGVVGGKRAQAPLLRCECGGLTTVRDVSDWRSRVDKALGQIRRNRECRACGAAVRTVELREAELQELRRLAHLALYADARRAA